MLEKQHEVIALLIFWGGKKLELESTTSNRPKPEYIRLNHWNVIPGERIHDVEKHFTHIGFVCNYRFMSCVFSKFLS